MISFLDRALTYFAIIIPKRLEAVNDIKLIESINHAQYKYDSDNHFILDIDLSLHEKVFNHPCFIGTFKNCIYIKNSSGIGSPFDFVGLTSILENYTFIKISRSSLNLSLNIYENEEKTLFITKADNSDTYRRSVDKKGLFKLDPDKEISDALYEDHVKALLLKLTENNDTYNVPLKKYVKININEILNGHIYHDAFVNNFPNLNDDDICSAWLAADIRNTVSEETRQLLYPDKKTIKRIIGSTIEDCIEPKFKLLSSGNLKHRNKTYVLEIGQLGSSMGYIELTISVRFKQIEKHLKAVLKNLKIEDYDTHLWKVLYTSFVFREKLDYVSYSSLALNLFWRIVYIQKHFIPKILGLTDYKILNDFVNYEDDFKNVLGLRQKFNHHLRKNPQYENPIIAIFAGDLNWENILQREVLNFINDESQKTSIFKEYEMLKAKINIE
jgi:hypothetical protein